MKKISPFLFSFILLFPYTVYAKVLSSSPNESLTFKGSYIGESFNNLSGGIKTGSCYLGMANILMSFDVEKAGLWKSGQFYVNAANTHGASPSVLLIGDMQVASNIEAGNHTYLQEVWYKQALGAVEFTAGLQDLNVELANSEHAALFLNSSFGVLPLISNNFSAPIFPLTTLGFTAKWNISERYSWINALYDGSPTDFDYNPYNVKWQFLSGDGLLAVSEFQYNTQIKKYSGIYKMGVYTHNHLVEKHFNKNFPDSLNHTLFGVYTYADQEVWSSNNKTMGVFAQLGYSPSAKSNNDFYVGLGLNFAGLFCKNQQDVLGLAIAHGSFKNKSKSETAIELTYRYQLKRSIFIQPDFQFIINPAGTDQTLHNSFAVNVRFGIEY
ncbi:MAG: carbohydrate porin [Paludibacter sp.]|nr:carbohydrate porin [Paludibacter sp.]